MQDRHPFKLGKQLLQPAGHFMQKVLFTTKPIGQVPFVEFN